MHRTNIRCLGQSLVTAVIFAGCANDPTIGTDSRSMPPTTAVAVFATAVNADARRTVDLGSCDSLQVPEGNKLAFHVYAVGVQIYRWNGTSWVFVAPSALLSADAEGNGIVGTHYAGPTWESNSGGTVVGAVLKRCAPDANSIPWLLLSAAAQGPGIFHRVNFIQRVNTVGGNAPLNPGSAVGEIANVPYTTEYLFYHAH